MSDKSPFPNQDLAFPPVMDEVVFYKGWKAMAAKVYQYSLDKGWWEDEALLDEARASDLITGSKWKAVLDKALAKLIQLNNNSKLALIHSEVSEALEGLRKPNLKSDKIPDFLAVEEELADVVIRIMDLCTRRGWRIAEAVLAKHEYNLGREHRHGGKSF